MLYKSDIEKITVSLWISGFDCSPDDITKQLGIQPTETIIKGEERWVSKKAIAPIKNRENAWRLKSELPQTVDPDKHLVNILQKIQPQKKKIIELAKKYSAKISFGIYWDYCNPGITLDKDILQELAEFNLELDFDMYYLGEKLKLETSHDRKRLEGMLKQLDFVSQYSNKKHNEAKTMTESLSEIENICDRLLGLFIPDLVEWDNLSESDWKNRLIKITNELKKIKKTINKSKYLHKNIVVSSN